MNFVQNFPFLSIILSLSGGVVCSILNGKKARNYVFFVLGAVFLMSSMTLSYVLETQSSYVYLMGHFTAPWGNEIRVGILECLMASLFSLVMILSLSGGLHHIEEDVEEPKENLYYTMISLLTSSLLALIYTNDLFTGYVFVEINTIASCALVMVRYRSKKALVATLRYLIMSLLGSGLFLIGICVLYDITGHLLMESISTAVNHLIATKTYLFPLAVVTTLFSLGLAIKSACYPFHTWLPDAHGNATVTSSSVLSGLVLKGYIFLLIKIFYRVLGLNIVSEEKALNILFIFGIFAMLYGSYKAIREKDLKRMLAYSSVAQVGYIYCGIGLGTTAGFTAACFQMIVHAVTKPMLFISTGGFMDVSNGSKKFKDLKGAGRRDLVSGIAFVVGSLSMIGIPFFAGFGTKVYLSNAAIELASAKMFITLIALAISTLLNACYYIPAMFTLFASSEHDTKAHYSKMYLFSIIIFIVLNFMVGLNSEQIFTWIVQGMSMFR